MQLRAFQQHLSEFRAANATLVAISPEMPDSSLKTTEKNKLQFEVVSDLSNVVARQYGVVYTLPEGMKANSAKRLKNYNGAEASDDLPIAATYVIDSEGKITFAFLESDYRKRVEPSDLLAHLHELAQRKNK